MNCRECKHKDFCRKYNIAKGSPACKKILEGKIEEFRQVLEAIKWKI